MTRSGTRGPRPKPSTVGGGTLSEKPPKSSQVTKMAVEAQSLLFDHCVDTEDMKFWAGRVDDGGWSDSPEVSGVTKLTAGRLLALASVMICVERTCGVLLMSCMYKGHPTMLVLP